MNPPDDESGAENAAEATGPAVPMSDEVVREIARRIFRDAVLSAVALTTRAAEDIDVPAESLIENADPSVVCQILAGVLSVVLEAALPDGGRKLLIHVSRRVIED